MFVNNILLKIIFDSFNLTHFLILLLAAKLFVCLMNLKEEKKDFVKKLVQKFLTRSVSEKLSQ